MTDERMKMVMDCIKQAKAMKREGLSLFMDAVWYCFDEYHTTHWMTYRAGTFVITDDDDNVLMELTR